LNPGVTYLDLKKIDSEDGFRTGCRNVSHKQQSFSGFQSPRRSSSIKQIVIVNSFLLKLLLVIESRPKVMNNFVLVEKSKLIVSFFKNDNTSIKTIAKLCRVLPFLSFIKRILKFYFKGKETEKAREALLE